MDDVTEEVRVERDGACWTVTIDRQHRRNALDDGTILQIMRLLAEAEAEDEVVGIVLTGAGGLAFCSGSDLKALATMSQRDQARHTVLGQKLMDSLESSTLLTAAAVEGYALGGGFELALACDLIVAGGSATFGLPELSNGMVPAWGGTFRLSRAIGLPRARAVILGGQVIDAEAAVATGLAMVAAPAGGALEAARKVVADVSRYATADTVGLVKQMLVNATRMDARSASLAEQLVETLQSRAYGYGVRP